MESEKPKIVKLQCPSISKIVAFAAWDEQKLDLGSIARAFGLDPSTLKLNGHFISRGLDFVSCSVTWKSLLKFFSVKGLSTGKDDKDAILVHGKLCKPGRKRGPDPQDSSFNYRTEREKVSVTTVSQTQDINLLMNKKLKDSNSGCELQNGDQVSKVSNGVGFKRKQLLEDVSLLKKLKINEDNTESGEKGNNYLGIVPSSKFKCSYISSNLKRAREDEVILAAPCKRIR